MNTTVEKTLHILEEHKAQAILHLDVTHLTPMTDHMIICTATSRQHARSLADKVRRDFKAELHQNPYMEGEVEGNWILIELDDALVHVMTEEARERYRLENLWDPDLR